MGRTVGGKVCIAVSDPIKAAELVSALRRLGLEFSFSRKDCDVVISDEDVKGGAVRVARRALLKILGLAEGRKGHIGIDPGPRPGVALVIDGIVLESFTSRDPKGAVSEVMRLVEDYDLREPVVKVGSGDVPFRNPIVNELLKMGFRVELVDEKVTKGAKDDAEAAELIAKTRGRPVSEELETRVTEGMIRDVQRRSRIASGGRVTINRELAKKVIRGEISLDEAVERTEEN